MNISAETIEFLVGLITGADGFAPHRGGPDLADFFDNRAEWEPFGAGFPADDVYVRDRLGVFNGSPRLKGYIEKAFEFDPADAARMARAAAHATPLLAADGFRLQKAMRPGYRYMDRDVPGRGYYRLLPL